MAKNILADLSNALAGTVARAGTAVVRVAGRRRLAATGIVWSADGVIVTANHVVTRDDKLKVGLADGPTVDATLVGRDPTTDLAVVRVDASDLTPLVEANKQHVGVGNLVLALGRPGNTVQATLGIISALGDSWRTRAGGQIDRYLQTDVVMYPGFSGGPLVNAEGALVGLNTSAVAQGVSLAIPTSTLSRVADGLLAHGRIQRGYLGVSTQRVRLPQNLRQELNQRGALLIVSVEAGSPAEKSGLAMGDTIVAFDGQPVRSHDDLLALLSSNRIGNELTMRIARGGKLEKLPVTIGTRP